MAKISAQQKLENKQRLDSLILNAVIVDGTIAFNKLTYKWLAAQSGLSVSTLQGYYNDRASFSSALQGQVMPLMLKHLNISSLSAFKSSWLSALNKPIFRRVMGLWIENLLDGDQRADSIAGAQRMQRHLNDLFGNEADNTVSLLIGESLLTLAQQHVDMLNL